MRTSLLDVENISKRFPGVCALDQVSLRVFAGEVLAVIGENGAGKSTLMKILAGVQQPDAGTIRCAGGPVVIDSVRTALSLGIALIHQELNLADNLSVGANIFLGREPRRCGGTLIDHDRIHAEAREVLSRIGLQISPATPVGHLSIGQKQLVEIAKALSVRARVLIMDEPTSSLSQQEAANLLRVVCQLRDEGVSIVYISHRLGEVQELADRVIVLRDGRNAGELAREEVNHGSMVRLMVGRDVSQFYARRQHRLGDEILGVDGLRTSMYPQHGNTFSLRAGEIVGVAGLVGAGRTEMLRALFGIDRPLAGNVRIAGRPVAICHTKDAIRAGLALVPEDRKQQGVILEMAIRTNVSLAGLYAHRRLGGFIDARHERQISDELGRRLRIRATSDAQRVRNLSGGNQQKVVLAKWLSLEPRVLLMDEPTRGIDIGAKEEIYQLMEQLASRGKGILFVSSEMEEILGMSDRVLVMHEGRLAGQLPRTDLSEQAIMNLATGRAA